MTRVRRVSLLILVIIMPGVSCASKTSDPAYDWSRSLESLTQVDDFPLYVMHYYGDYDLIDGQAVPAGSVGAERDAAPAGFEQGCTCFSAPGRGGEAVFGRNFDWYDHPALLLFTHPPERYASVSMVDISYLGFSKEDSPADRPDRLRSLPFLPFDGMNEHGLCVGIMALPHAEPPSDSEKRTVGSLQIIRIILDCAQNLEEAIAIFHTYNIDFSGGPPLHYMIMDESGKSAVVEFVNGKIVVLTGDDEWQVATNFILNGLSQEEKRSSCYRYRTASDALEDAGGSISEEEAMTILERVSQSNTIWSVVYSPSRSRLRVMMGREFGSPHEFGL